MDVRSAVGRFRRPRGLRRVGEFPAPWPAHPGGRRSAELVAPRGERGPPDSARGGKALKDPPASRIDDEALITPWAGGHVGEINSWPAHERRGQRIALRIENSLRSRPAATRTATAAPAIGPSRDTRKRSRRASSPPDKRSAALESTSLSCFVLRGFRSEDLRRRMRRGYGVAAGSVRESGANAREPINFA